MRIFLIFLGVLLTSFFLPFAYPDFNYFWLAWVALAPLILVFNFISARASFFYGWVFGALFCMQNLIWLYLFGWPPGIAGSLYYGLFPAFFVFTASWFSRKLKPEDWWFRLFLIPSLWILFEFLKSLGIFGTTWGELASSQYKFLPVLQVLPWIGGYGLSWLVVMFNTFLAEILYQCFFVKKGFLKSRKFKYYTAFVLSLMFLVLIFGIIQLKSFKVEPGIKVALVQPDVDQAMRGGERSYYLQVRNLENLTFLAKRYDPALVVWPETSILEFLRYSKSAGWFSMMSRSGNFYLLIGAQDIDDEKKIYNSAFLFSPHSGLGEVYRKKRLVPFGEYVLLKKWLGDFKIFDRVGDYSPGGETVIFDCCFGKFFTLVCFESTFPSMAAEGMRQGANFLTVITNDSWFEKTHAAENHLALTVLRSVENRIYALLCSNTGMSAIIEPTGKIQNCSRMYEKAVVAGLIGLQNEKSFYCRFGPLVLWLSLIIILIVLINRKRR